MIALAMVDIESSLVGGRSVHSFRYGQKNAHNASIARAGHLARVRELSSLAIGVTKGGV